MSFASAEQHLHVALIARSLLDPLVHGYCRVVDLTSRPDVQDILVYTGMSIYQYIPVYTRPQNHYTSILPPIMEGIGSRVNPNSLTREEDIVILCRQFEVVSDPAGDVGCLVG